VLISEPISIQKLVIKIDFLLHIILVLTWHDRSYTSLTKSENIETCNMHMTHESICHISNFVLYSEDKTWQGQQEVLPSNKLKQLMVQGEI
jgi:hypothetical protein